MKLLKSKLLLLQTRTFCQSSHLHYYSSNNSILRNVTNNLNHNSSQKVDLPSGGRGGSEYKNSRSNDSNPTHSYNKVRRPKKIVINWRTGTERAQMAANSIIAEIFKLNEKGDIMFIAPGSNKLESSNVRKFARGLDLGQYGLSIVNVEKVSGFNGNRRQVPLIKIVDSEVALRKYADELGKRKRDELVELGVLSKNNTGPKRDTSLKHIRVSWRINLDDLEHQKAYEINKLLKRGHKVNLYLDEGQQPSKDWILNFQNTLTDSGSKDSISKRDKAQRKIVLERIQELVDEWSTTPAIEGTIYGKMIMKLAPRIIPNDNKDKMNLKNERKKERQLKIQERIERKKLRESTPM
ncbi:Aim23p KNAG_0C02680 [Huiozyma naganishii CBS 8797]|uniref:Altered inheritance of mitochondria protein 23, mitochondrial n=1 Tax=Huiozyma naganishii (strain ATCC MYA-139 / BCRC 22969 / CBS 8797 / KCTC 17520 / NBRC 10181 / NCYC 3082 / Yp74L-3) TaxID=1071383 RepID=J7S4N0_HUIN7|nr:hypothetical protein KNAG_0C02680 [Kazachstania naganishii CBS 8797]CCK69379.1 hypothetical protein KNAG_0C02680 [Kazachstania naganishii CBS 8797]